MRRFLLSLLLLLPFVVSAQTLRGDWSGKLSLPIGKLRMVIYNPQNEACGTSQTKRTPTHPAEKKRSVTFSGNIPRAFGNHPNALLASVK